jgi:hypothetical protein
LIEAGLPNINGAADFPAVYSSNGSFQVSGTGYTWNITGAQYYKTLNFNASLSSSVYGNADTVQPQAIKGFVYMVVANRTKTQIVADIDEIAADLQLKADVDLGNVTSTGQVRMAHAAMPSTQYIDLTVPANGGTVTAPADGWIMLLGTYSASPAIVKLWNVPQNIADGGLMGYSAVTTNTITIYATTPVAKNNKVTVEYTNVTGLKLRFVYAIGSVPA